MPFTDQYPTQRIPIHPWKHNLRDMSGMLAGEIDLPHVVFKVFKVTILSDFSVTPQAGSEELKGCEDCCAAYRLREQYQQDLKDHHGSL